MKFSVTADITEGAVETLASLYPVPWRAVIRPTEARVVDALGNVVMVVASGDARPIGFILGVSANMMNAAHGIPSLPVIYDIPSGEVKNPTPPDVG